MTEREWDGRLEAQQVKQELSEIERLTAENAELRAMLKRLEWCEQGGECPICHCYRVGGHAESCELSKLIQNTCSHGQD